VPTSLQALLDAYADALHSFHETARQVGAEQWSRPTDCPGWSVREQVAHVLALELQLGGAPLPPALDAYPEHVRNESGRHMENGIAALRDVPTDELVTRLGDAVEAHLGQLRALDLDPGTVVRGTLGSEVPLARFLPIRVLDVWTHEQDVRVATGRALRTSGPATEVAREQTLGLVPLFVVQGAQLPAGTSFALDAPGPLGGQLTVRVGEEGPESSDGVDDDADVTLRMSDLTFMRLTGGRVSPADADVELVGDAQLGRRILDHLAFAP
jgi:uncharacterized protein (TIGR03083 family)